LYGSFLFLTKLVIERKDNLHLASTLELIILLQLVIVNTKYLLYFFIIKKEYNKNRVLVSQPTSNIYTKKQ